ncbi:MAG: Cof-type HAD-IIB family hydrolase [Tannerella sp.]|jgi:Cof subfamily protein (haloacid dehalogenase superfamily)|nr:Cof-type HAD-IIB family hydrolase [Tannerella sp.]
MDRKSPQIKAVFFDIDGTLVSFKTHTIPPATKAAVNRLRDNGIKVIIATGRAKKDLINLEDIVFDGYITCNGAYCIDYKGDVIARHPISKESMERLYVHLQEKPFSCTFQTETGNFINYADEAMLTLCKLVKVPLPDAVPLQEIIKQPIFQLDAFIDELREAELLRDVLTDCVGCRWHPIFIDFNSQECSKATGINHFADYFGISREETMAFGDGGNDISMLQHAGIGVAMGNAKAHVKAAANHVTSHVDDDGVVRALRRFGLITE